MAKTDYLTINLTGRSVQLTLELWGDEAAETWLLLPALSTVSSRSEWHQFAKSINKKIKLVSFDWPGFGDSDRPAIKYDFQVLRTALNAVLDYVQNNTTGQISVIAAGHAASVALAIADERSKQWKQLVLVAPTWRGPLPTMTGWKPSQFKWLRQLVSLPVIGSILYRFNTSRAVLKLMLRRHVWVKPCMFTSEAVQQQQQLSRKKGARFASVSFVSGGFDPANHRDLWLSMAEQLSCPLRLVLAGEAPPRSKKEMQELAKTADQVLIIKGRLGLHQEFGWELADLLID